MLLFVCVVRQREIDWLEGKLWMLAGQGRLMKGWSSVLTRRDSINYVSGSGSARSFRLINEATKDMG